MTQNVAPQIRHRTGRLAVMLAALTALAQPMQAQDRSVPGLSIYGTPGHVMMPSALALPDGELAFTVNAQDVGAASGTLAFQITPRVTGVFRYAYFKDFHGESLYDRSFDLRYQILREDPGGWRPALSVGLQDFGGTGVLGAEYLVASRHFADGRVLASAGLGWGRFGSYGGFRNPLAVLSDRFETRGQIQSMSETGRVAFDRFFRGDAALFMALDWQATDRLSLALEYSSDAMEEEVARMGYRHRTPVNLGAEYRLGNGATLGLAVLNGSTAALSYSITLNPARPPAPSGREPAPPPVMPGAGAAASSWGLAPRGDGPVQDRLAAGLDAQGITLDTLRIEGDTATVMVQNRIWGAQAQATGRTARVMSAHLPAGVTQFRIQTSAKGMALHEVRVTRHDLEDLEFAPDGAWQIWARAGITDAATLPDPLPLPAPGFSYALKPYLVPSFFDPDDPLRFDIGAELSGAWSPRAGLIFSGALRQKVVGTLDESTRVSDSIQQHVRSDAALYAKESGPTIPWATVEYFNRPGKDLYGRVSFGLLEQMFGGVSTELLWAPTDRNYAIGLELNHVVQRDFDGLGFQDYDVTTGHLSGYLDLGGGYETRLDAGRYLAGDWGATLALDRQFANGFRVGAFFTITDIGFDDFGEGSFDKGVVLTLPVSWLTGEPGLAGGGVTLRPILRDGGARLSVRNRLHDITRADRDMATGERWGRFWR